MLTRVEVFAADNVTAIIEKEEKETLDIVNYHPTQLKIMNTISDLVFNDLLLDTIQEVQAVVQR